MPTPSSARDRGRSSNPRRTAAVDATQECGRNRLPSHPHEELGPPPAPSPEGWAQNPGVRAGLTLGEHEDGLRGAVHGQRVGALHGAAPRPRHAVAAPGVGEPQALQG